MGYEYITHCKSISIISCASWRNISEQSLRNRPSHRRGHRVRPKGWHRCRFRWLADLINNEFFKLRLNLNISRRLEINNINWDISEDPPFFLAWLKTIQNISKPKTCFSVMLNVATEARAFEYCLVKMGHWWWLRPEGGSLVVLMSWSCFVPFRHPPVAAKTIEVALCSQCSEDFWRSKGVSELF